MATAEFRGFEPRDRTGASEGLSSPDPDAFAEKIRRARADAGSRVSAAADPALAEPAELDADEANAERRGTRG